MSDVLHNIATIVGALVIGGGTVSGLAFLLFRFFAEKWLSAKFAERLETFKG
jgi:hypothetical protein